MSTRLGCSSLITREVWEIDPQYGTVLVRDHTGTKSNMESLALQYQSEGHRMTLNVQDPADSSLTVRIGGQGYFGGDDTTERYDFYREETEHSLWDLEEVAEVMERKKIRRLPVLGRDGQLSGIVSLSDIAVKAHDEKLVEKILESAAGRSAPV